MLKTFQSCFIGEFLVENGPKTDNLNSNFGWWQLLIANTLERNRHLACPGKKSDLGGDVVAFLSSLTLALTYPWIIYPHNKRKLSKSNSGNKILFFLYQI